MDNEITPIIVDSLPTIPAEKESNISKVEAQLVDYYKEITESTNSDLEFNEELKQELRLKFSEMSAKELMNFYTNYNVNLNDKISKSLAPVSQLLTAKQQAEIAEQAKKERMVQSATQINIQASGGSPSDYEKKNQEADAAVIQGLNMIYQLMQAANQKTES